MREGNEGFLRLSEQPRLQGAQDVLCPVQAQVRHLQGKTSIMIFPLRHPNFFCFIIGGLKKWCVSEI